MRGLPRAEPTTAELVARQEWLEQCREAEERRRIQHHHDQLDAEARAAAEDRERQWRALRAQDEERQAAQRRRSAEIAERTRQRDHERSVYNKLMAAERFRNEAVAAARRNAVIQQRQALIDDLDRSINPPPAPEAPVIIVEQQSEGSAELGSADFDIAAFNKKPRSWW